MDATPAARAAPRSRRGFTLVEVVLAVFVLALAMVTSLAALQRAFLNLDTARNLEIAANILQCEMEKQRVFDWAQLTSATGATRKAAAPTPASRATRRWAGASRSRAP